MSRVANPRPNIMATAMDTKNPSVKSGIMPMMVVKAVRPAGDVQANPFPKS